MSLQSLHDMYEKKTKKPVITHTGEQPINQHTKSQKKGKTMSFLSKVNNTTRKHLGSTGRVLTEAAAVSGGAYLIGSKFDIEALQNPYVLAGLAVAGTVVAEGTLYFFGDDSTEQVLEAADVFREVKELSEEQAQELYANIEQHGGDGTAEAILGLKMLRGEVTAPNTAKVPRQGNQAAG